MNAPIIPISLPDDPTPPRRRVRKERPVTAEALAAVDAALPAIRRGATC